MPAYLARITVFCFAASYAVALALVLVRQLGPYPALRLLSLCLGFVARVMYLVQVCRLRAKVPPGRGVKLPNLERLQGMIRRGLILSFPLLTAGILVGGALLLYAGQALAGMGSPRILSAIAL